ncbi:hypothetical protein SAMN05421736_101796 [Evansella caseinilytica]|uniref:Uncharacterized protein n=1 Tax=Evansella caseinilytica TaxID=1503961 RepID=A0A1H3IDK4_9BACI|nr:PHP-associated domain-containing protein [Evansella caseinilytica]SDY25933.1 hypothetical protein SAMN05421736_101796 [Evansella caseinilytica]
MQIDFHSHVKISKKSSFMPEYFREMMTEARAAGLTALAVTEHFNTARFMDIYTFLQAHYPYEHDYYNIDGLKLFPGIEVDVKEGGHILLIGGGSKVLAIRRALKSHTVPDAFIPFDRLLDLADEYDMLTIGAHPYRESTPLHQLTLRQLQRLDAFDLNGKDLYTQGIDFYRQRIADFAAAVGKPVVAGSDTHQFLQYGCVVTKLANDCDTVEELKHCIKMGKYQIHISNDLRLKVKSATLVKKYMKKLL